MSDGAKPSPENNVGVSSIYVFFTNNRLIFRAQLNLQLRMWSLIGLRRTPRAHHEKRVAAELGARSVEHFLPLYSSVRRWKDRRVQLELPLFPGYVFVRLPFSEGCAPYRFQA